MPDDNTKPFEPGQGTATLILKEGVVLGEYRLVQFLGAGSFGDVWKADKTGTDVALKVMNRSTSAEELEREKRALAALEGLRHPYLLQTNRHWINDNGLFIEMELADGGSLKERLQAVRALGMQGIPEHELLKYFVETAQALDYLHGQAKKFLHRDIKPANIVLVKGCAKLADFGLLRQVSGEHTGTKTQGGTALYMAPESIIGNNFSVYTDEFSFAITYAELRQGKPPFSGKTLWQIGERIVKAAPELSDDIFYPEEKKVVLKALDKDPYKRYPGCGEFVDALSHAIPSRFRERAGGGIGFSRESESAELDATLPPDTNRQPLAGDGTEPKTQRGHDTSLKGRPERLTDPGFALPEPELDPEGTLPPSSATDRKSTQTAKETKTARTAPPVPAVKPWVPPAPPPRRILTARRVIALVLVVSAVTGYWLFNNLGIRNHVRELAKKGEFAEAARTIKDTSRFFLPLPDALRDEAEREGLSKLEKDAEAVKDDLQALREHENNLHRFEDAFPKNTRLPKLLDSVAQRIEKLRKLPIIVAGAPSDDKKFDALLKQAQDDLVKNQIDKCLQSLKEAKQLVQANKVGATRKEALEDAYDDLRKGLIREVIDADFPKEKAHVVLMKIGQLAPYLQDGNLQWDSATLDKLDANLASAHVHLNDAAKAYPIYRALMATKDKSRLVQQHTAFFLRLDEELTKLPDIAASQPHLHLQLLSEAAKAQKEEVVTFELVKYLGNENLAADLRKELWLVLGRLAMKGKKFSVAHLRALDKAVKPPAGEDKDIKQINARIIKSVLEPLVEADLPKADELAEYVGWCERIVSPSDALLTFKAECLVESGQAVKPGSFPNIGWYGSYVGALILNQEKKLIPAADELARMFKIDPKIPSKARQQKAAALLQTALTKLPRTGNREFRDANDAQRCIDWQALLEKSGVAPADAALDGVIDFVFAAIKLGDARRLADIDMRVRKLPPASQLEGHSWVAKAYRTQPAFEAQVFAAYNSALKLGDAKNPQWTAVAKDAADFALTLAEQQVAAAKKDAKLAQRVNDNSKRASDYISQLKSSELPLAATLHRRVVGVHLQLAGDLAAVHKVYADALKEPLEPIHLPVLVDKLTRVSDQLFYQAATDYSGAQMEAALKEGDRALQLAAAGAKSDRDWLAELKVTTMMKLADVRFGFKDAKYQMMFDPQKAEAFPKEEYFAFLEETLNFYTQARDKKYPAKAGEFAYKVGCVRQLLGTNILYFELLKKENADAKTLKKNFESLKVAKKELEESKGYWPALSKLRRDHVTAYLGQIQNWEKDERVNKLP